MNKSKKSEEAELNDKPKPRPLIDDNTQAKQKDHDKLDNFIGSVLDYYKHGQVSKERAIGAIANVMTARGQDNNVNNIWPNWQRCLEGCYPSYVCSSVFEVLLQIECKKV